MTELCDLAYKYGTDKCPQIKHHYTEYYHSIFSEKRNSVRRVIEVGIGDAHYIENCPHTTIGASLWMWREYFPNAHIVGIDNNFGSMFGAPRIRTYLCDQTNSGCMTDIVGSMKKYIDLFIDDGSHKPEDQITTCLMIMPLLPDYVVYAIEDVGKPSIAKVIGEKYKCEFVKFKKKACWDDRLLVVRHG